MTVRAAAEIEAGLCRSCRHVRVVKSDRESTFYQCRRALTDPAYPAYPRLPVLRCPGYERQGDPSAAPDGPARIEH